MALVKCRTKPVTLSRKQENNSMTSASIVQIRFYNLLKMNWILKQDTRVCRKRRLVHTFNWCGRSTATDCYDYVTRKPTIPIQNCYIKPFHISIRNFVVKSLSSDVYPYIQLHNLPFSVSGNAFQPSKLISLAQQRKIVFHAISFRTNQSSQF